MSGLTVKFQNPKVKPKKIYINMNSFNFDLGFKILPAI